MNKKMRRIVRKKILSFIGSLVIIIGVFGDRKVVAAKQTGGIMVRTFIKLLVTEMKLPLEDKIESNTYIKAAYQANILQSGDFESYRKKITRAECAMLLNRADEYLHKDVVIKSTLIDEIIEKRISDIKEIKKELRVPVAKIYAKGIMKGYSNGYGIKSRRFLGNNYVGKASTKNFIDLTLHPKKRAKIAPNGLLIRTTNLPKNAKKFSYILDCFPNKYYDRRFYQDIYVEKDTFKEYKDYVLPVHMKNAKYKNVFYEYPMQEQMDLYGEEWIEMAETFIKCIFNVDYRTIEKNKKWRETLKANSVELNISADDYLDRYIERMKKHHTIVETSVVSTDISGCYDSCDGLCLRVYVKYRVSATDIPKDNTELILSGHTYIKGLTLNEWRTDIIDVLFASENGFTGEGDSLKPLLRFLLFTK